MVRLIAAIIFVNLSFVCFGQEKFLELKDVMNAFEKNESLDYSLPDCNLLEHFDSLYADMEEYDLLYIDHRKIALKNKYENIEALVTNLDKKILRYFKDIFGMAPGLKDAHGREIEIGFPVLKDKNRVFLYMYSTHAWHSFIIELKESKKARIALIHFLYETPDFGW